MAAWITPCTALRFIDVGTRDAPPDQRLDVFEFDAQDGNGVVVGDGHGASLTGSRGQSRISRGLALMAETNTELEGLLA